VFAGLGRIVLAVGAILIVSALVIDHPPIYLGGTVEYPWQAIAIAKRMCGASQPDLLKDPSLPWRAWLNYDDRKSADVWIAGFSVRHGDCLLSMDPKTGQPLDMRMGAE
jgi:hypothetical protein